MEDKLNSEELKEHLILFLTHFDDYLDVCLSLDDATIFEPIRKLKYKLNTDVKSNLISTDEYIRREADIFLAYLKILEDIKK